MPTTRVPATEIQSWTPAVDVRASDSGSIFVIEGKNYLFDSMGPRSGFGNKVIEGGSIDSTIHAIQSIEKDDRSLVLTQDGVYDRRNELILTDNSASAGKDYWFRLAELPEIPDSLAGKVIWTGAFVGSGQYICNPYQGLFKVLGDSIEDYAGTADVDYPISISEANGRLVILTKYTLMYSNAFDAEDLTPAAGGAGFQVVNELVPGTPVTVTSYQGGFLVWTTAGVMLAEYVGGEIVYRFDRVITDQIIISPNAWCSMATGVILAVTNQGLFQTNLQSGLTPVSAIFNEFLRDLFVGIDSPNVRLDYFTEFDLLYLQIQDGSPYFNRTFVFSFALEKWGEFNETHKGICRFSASSGDYGYFDTDGVAHRFLDLPYNILADSTLVGIDSFISLGFFRPTGGVPYADVEFEMQEILVGAVDKIPSNGEIIEEDWGGQFSFISYNIGFYSDQEDWNKYGVADADEDWNYPVGVDEDWNQHGTSFDMNASVTGSIEAIATFNDVDGIDYIATFNDTDGIDYIAVFEAYSEGRDWNEPGVAEDWNIGVTDGQVSKTLNEDWLLTKFKPDEDWTGKYALENRINYQLWVESNMDGYEEQLRVYPSLAVEKIESDLWTLFSNGYNHRLIFSANQPWEKFHIKTLATTIGLAGQTS